MASHSRVCSRDILVNANINMSDTGVEISQPLFLCGFGGP